MCIRNTVRPLVLGALTCTLSLTSASPHRVVTQAGLAFPPLVLWAWERPTDLRQIPPQTGVAFLAQTLLISSTRVTVHPRRQKLQVRPDTPLLAVTRIEAEAGVRGSFDAARLDDVARWIAATAQLPRVRGIQVDFDATASQRQAYRDLLWRVRQHVGPATPVSMTALASWCMGDRWLRGLPVDEVVPMLFRMGAGELQWRRRVLHSEMRAPECRHALGVALDEPLPLQAGRPRVYVFNAAGWTSTAIEAARRRGLQ